MMMKSKNSGGIFRCRRPAAAVLRLHAASAGLISSAASSSGSSFRIEYMRWMVLMQTWLSLATNEDLRRCTL